MTELEKVMSALECLTGEKHPNCKNCRYADTEDEWDGCNQEKVIADALSLLKVGRQNT